MLRPVYRQNGIIYCPVDTKKGAYRRRIITQAEAYHLLEIAPKLEDIESSNRKEFDEKCKEAISSGQCNEWLKVIKTLLREQHLRKQAGKRLATTHERILKTAADNLCGELAVSLNKDISQIESLLRDLLTTSSK